MRRVVLSAVQWRFGLCGPGFYGYLILWIPLWCSKLTTIATSTTTTTATSTSTALATATAERLFEALRIYKFRLRSISGFEVLEGGEGNSFYGSRFGGTTVL